ncbi:uncharacterized protein LOC110897533 isoform X3 [Helianthus annuus]|uniref:uncharacterized protein LOC110897533 isoform X3 n=1 Tax=Helianthus annuus TaxID=4232 RepID=UPI000B8F9ADD|nr:uncharacterized protein LOC110897533 isoform X3 [Helianthus annuus]
MASPEDQSNTKTEEGTTALYKKRSRRVSFAENTSVHFFDRDESLETPPDPEPPSTPSADDDTDASGPDFPFIRVLGSPSPTASSATSNDAEDNFFGPVSANFIRRDLSDSANSDDNHDQTMDSTAFSMHFRSLARSDSEDMKTSTRVPLSFEEKTPTSSSITSGTRNTMQLTLVNKPNSQPDVSTSKLSAGSQSNDMSLVGEYQNKYDYGKLSPAMDPLLAEDNNDLHSVSHISIPKSPIKAGKQNGNEPDFMDFSYGQDNNIKGITSDGEHIEVDSVKQNEMDVSDDGSKLHPNKQTALGVMSNTFDTQGSKSPAPNQSIRDTLTVKTNERVKDAFEINSNLDLLGTSQRTPSNHMDMVYQTNESPLLGSITHFTDRPSHMLLNGVGLFKSPGPVTPSNNPASVAQRASVSSLQKSISKLRALEVSPVSAALNAKLEDSSSRSLAGLSKMTSLGNLLEKEAAFRKMDGNKTETPQNLVVKDDENKIGSAQTLNSSSKKLKKTTPAKFGVSLIRDEEQPIQHNESLATASDGTRKGGDNSPPVNVAGSNIEEKVHENVHNSSETKVNTTNLSNNIENEKFQPVFRGNDISIGRMKASISLNGRMDEKSCHKNLADQFDRSPSNKELHSVLHNENNGSVHAESVPSEVSSAERKRKAEHVTTDKIAKIKMSSNSGLELSSDGEMPRTGPNLEHLTEIHTRFFKEAKLFSHSVDKMNLHAIDRLVDILGQLQRFKTYQLLSTEMRSQDKKAAETVLILSKFVHEQAKLQLMRMKRGRLLKNVHSLASGIRESETLNLNSSQNSLDVQVIHQQSLPDNSKDIQECQVDKEKMTLMTQAIKDTDRRISDLTKSFHISCKMKGEPNTADTIAYANTHFVKRAHCQILRKDLQLWVVDDLNSSKDHHEVVLNYLGLMSQRLTVTAGVVPRLSISNTLNQMTIHKKHAAATSMAQETQMASSLLGNLVDVMEEIQLAKIELKNLIYARFHTSLDERLDLELYFFDPNSRKKATITLNTSCLKRGIYPSEIDACQIGVSVEGSRTSSNEKLSAEIAAAVKNLRVGYFRILRLCKCISQLISVQV